MGIINFGPCDCCGGGGEPRTCSECLETIAGIGVTISGFPVSGTCFVCGGKVVRSLDGDYGLTLGGPVGWHINFGVRADPANRGLLIVDVDTLGCIEDRKYLLSIGAAVSCTNGIVTFDGDLVYQTFTNNQFVGTCGEPMLSASAPSGCTATSESVGTPHFGTACMSFECLQTTPKFSYRIL